MGDVRGLVAAVVTIGALGLAAPAGARPPDLPPAPTYEVRESVEQLSITGLEPGTRVDLLEPAGRGRHRGRVVRHATADDLGSVLFRDLRPGRGYAVSADGATTRGLVVDSVGSSQPAQSLYDDQQLDEGFQYLKTRDGTELSINVVLPGPIEDGPYPTVVEYSGYDPSNPLAGLGAIAPGIDPTPLCGALPVLCKAPAQPASLLAGVMGYAVVGVNVRGTGCSGGAYDFFETLQVLDGYDVIETVAAQDWVTGHEVGMVGLSYPGISQLFVAQSQPPSLAAITPLSVYGDTGTGVLRPGGILNTGFATAWADQVLANAEPSGTAWVRQLIAEGDERCADNQRLRLQNVDATQKALDNPYYTDEVAGPLDIRRFAGDIEVPVFLASAWQDEQTGPSFADLLDRFDASPVTRFTLYNGLHADGFAPQILSEWKAFLDLYVADQVPSIDPLVRSLTPIFTEGIFGGAVSLPPDRWADVATADEARARFEAEDPVRVIFESGAGAEPGLPVGAFERTAAQWPDPDVSSRRWWLTPQGELTSAPPAARTTAVGIEHDAAVGTTTFWSGGSGIWQALPDYHWEPAAPGRQAAFETAPLTETVTMLGTGSVDLWVQSSAADADLEVIVSEVRPDGHEMLVQSGRLRASYRKLEASSTELHPIQLGREESIAPLPAGEWTPMRVLVPAFGHVFRPGSRVRVTVNTPGGDQPTWAYDLLELPAGTRHLIGTGGVAASSVALPVLPVLPGTAVGTPRPGCPSLRGQPCRATPSIANVEVAVPEPPRPGDRRCAGITSATGTKVDDRRASDARLRRCLRLNQIQVLGSHNSYKQPVVPEILAALRAFDPALAASLEYSHVGLAEQFTGQAIRQIELDVFADPEGGTYAGRIGLGVVGLPNDPPPELLEPGFKVLHVQDLDFNSSCLTFVECLRQVEAWSDANPRHLPIAILVELKDDPIPDPLGLGFVTPHPIGPAELDALDAEIRSVVGEDDMITPDDVRGDHGTLEDAVRSGLWPTLEEAEGKLLFLMDNGGADRDAYRAGRPSLEGRVLFTNAEPGAADAAFVKVNDPIGNVDRIQDLVAAGYVVRTRADEPTIQARTGDTTQRDAALESAAQWVSTDYPVPGSSPFSDYFAAIPDGAPARCNPVNTGPRCRNDGLERARGKS
jgi:predicted acyl esterase